MSERLLCERDVLNKLGWPSRRYIDQRIKNEDFPRPRRQSHGIGDQWRERDIDRWLGLGDKAAVKSGEEALLERFASAP